MASFKQIWRDPVGSAVIAGLILAAGGAILSTWLEWWAAIWSGVKAAVGWFIADSALPNWLIVIGVCWLGVALIRLIRFILAKKAKQDSNISIYDYQADSFFGVDWVWRWHRGRYDEIRDACPLCPRCKYQLSMQDEFAHGSSDLITRFFCEACEAPVSSEPCPSDEINDRLRKRVHQKIRTGQWVDAVGR